MDPQNYTVGPCSRFIESSPHLVFENASEFMDCSTLNYWHIVVQSNMTKLWRLFVGTRQPWSWTLLLLLFYFSQSSHLNYFSVRSYEKQLFLLRTISRCTQTTYTSPQVLRSFLVRNMERQALQTVKTVGNDNSECFYFWRIRKSFSEVGVMDWASTRAWEPDSPRIYFEIPSFSFKCPQINSVRQTVKAMINFRKNFVGVSL